MNNKRKICFVTGTRAEYGIFSPLMEEVKSDENLIFQLIVTGMHLSHEFGYTYKKIIEDGFEINKKIEILLSTDSSVGVGKAMGLGLISFSEAFEELRPDIIVVLGDRFEILAAVSAAMVSKIPIAHIHGGEVTKGAYDDSIRHSISKMAHLHFVSTDMYRKRVIQLGEIPDRVFVVGAPGLDNIKKLKLLSMRELEKQINFEFNQKNVLVTFHPATLEKIDTKKQVEELLSALDCLKDTNIILTKANADDEGRLINVMLDDFAATRENCTVCTSLGQLRYLSAIQYMDMVIGNSSSGIIEVPSFCKPTINIGIRQEGRIKAESVIDCSPDKKAILCAIETAYSVNFQKKIKFMKNPYDYGNATKRILEIIKSYNLSNILIKDFFDIDFNLK